MSLIENFRAKRRERIIKAAVAAGLTVPSVRNLRNSRIARWIFGDFTLKNSELIFSAVSRIANSLSSMPIQLYRRSTPVNNELNLLLTSEPNPSMTSCQFIKALEACRGTAGNCYALKVYNTNFNLVRLDLLDPARVQPVMNIDTAEMWYLISPENGPQMYVHGFYVIHIPFISANGYSGISPVSVLQNTLEYSASIQQFSKEQLDKGVNAAIVLEAPANLGESQKKDMVNDFISTYRETSGNIILLESGVTAKNLNLSPVDTRLFEVEKITRSKVAMVYNIPPHLLGDYSDTSFSSQEQQMLEYLMLTLLPIVTAYEQELNRKLLTKEERRRGYHWRFDMDAILRADAATQAEVDYKSIRSALKTPDEARAGRYLPPLPGKIGQKALISQDLATLDYTVNTKPAVLAGGKTDPPSTPQMPPQEE